jgi:hypothetical protein
MNATVQRGSTGQVFLVVENDATGLPVRLVVQATDLNTSDDEVQRLVEGAINT